MVVDLQMPEINGLDLMNEIIASGVRVPFIFITAYPNPEDRSKAMFAGAAAYLEKPFDDWELFDTIRTVCEGESE